MYRIHTSFSRLLASAILLLAPLSAFADDAVPLDASTPHKEATIMFKDDQGHTITLDPAAAKLTIVHFWATWCTPCSAEMPEVDAAQASYDSKDLKIITLSMDGDNQADKVKAFFTEHNIAHLTPYLDRGMESFNAIHSPGLPTTLFINHTGKEIARAEGPLDWKSKETIGFIEKALH